VPDYAKDQRHAYAIDDQMKKLGCLERYNKELLNGSCHLMSNT